MKFWVACLAMAALLIDGCASRQPVDSSAGGSALKSSPIVTPGETLTGTVLRVNTLQRFAVLNFPLGTQPVLEERLSVYRHGLKVGEVRICGPQVEDNIVADILNGEAQAGDEVRAP